MSLFRSATVPTDCDRARRRLPGWFLAVGIATATACHGEYLERETSLPPEALEAVSCPSRDCLVVEERSTYCSVDPAVLPEGDIFSHKSRLQIAAGVYPLSGAAALSGLEFRLETRASQATLSPLGRARYRLYRDEEDRETRIAPLRWLEVNTDLGGEGASVGNMLLKLPRWPHAQFRLGNPEDSAWFFAASRTVLLRLAPENALFPGLAGRSVRYVPCAMPGLADQPFRFHFAGGDILDLTVRSASGSLQVGYFVASLVRAQGRVGDEFLDIDDLDDLGLFGSSWSGGEATIPAFALRTRQSGEACGLILDSSEWDSDRAVDGYVAHVMTCDGTRGRPLSLEKVSYPDFFALP